MTVSQIKKELRELEVSTHDVFEKAELIQRLLRARKESRNEKPQKQKPDAPRPLLTKLLLTPMDSVVEIDGGNNSMGVMKPNPQFFATLEAKVGGTTTNKNNNQTVRLLVDTACSGFVVRSRVVSALGLPTYQSPVTMTGAGGTTSSSSGQISQFPSLQLKDCTEANVNTISGPFPVSIQEIDALPSSLDGIIGLSFLNRFAQIEFNFQQEQIGLYSMPTNKNNGALITHAPMAMLPGLGIYTVPVMFGTRGPVQMLVDTGAASTFLSWKGVRDLGLSQSDSNIIRPIPNPMGALGSDNIAIRLTHRLHVSSSIHLGKTTDVGPGLVLSKETRLPIDIGNIPVLDSLEPLGVGGILGMDVMRLCSAIRVTLKGTPELEFFAAEV